MNNLIGGLTPREHFHLHGTLPNGAIERLLDLTDQFANFVAIVTEISADVINQAYKNPENFDLERVQALLKILREINQ